MHHNTTKYWKSLEQRDGESPTAPETSSPGLSRRHFLEAAGFTATVSAMAGCGRAPTITALPFVNQPDGSIPGVSQQFATTCAGCPAGCGMLVTSRDGRPLKMEGSPQHPLSQGGLCAVGQAVTMELYDSLRLQKPLLAGTSSDWQSVDQAIAAKLADIKQQKGAVRFVTSSVTSPTLQSAIQQFLTQFTNARHVTFDAQSSHAIVAAHQATHGAAVLPRYRFDKAKTIVSLGADFLGTWISPVEHAAAWRGRRVPTEKSPRMSFHAQLEGRLSLTGTNADRRFRVSPVEYGAMLTELAKRMAQRAQQSIPDVPDHSLPIAESEVEDLVDRLWHDRGASLVVCDSQDTAEQQVVNLINHLLGNYDKTIDLFRYSYQRQGRDNDVESLITELKSGRVAALFVARTDLTYNLPDPAIKEAIRQVPLLVSLADRPDDLSALAHYVCPESHPLESWSDAEPTNGLVSISQPTIQPLGDTRSILESLYRWSGKDESAYDIVRNHWRKEVFPRSMASSFRQFWDKTVHDGFAEVKPIQVNVRAFDSTKLPRLPVQQNRATTLSLYRPVAIPDGRHAHNPWLQELPDPISKVTWDNYVGVSPEKARTLGVSNGDIVRVSDAAGTATIELPVCVQPGHHDQVVSVALGYGVPGTERFERIGPQWLEARPTVKRGQPVGKNAAAFLEIQGGTLRYDGKPVQLAKVSGRRVLASTQAHHSLEVPKNVAPHGAEVRDIVQETTLPEFARDAHAGTPHLHHHTDMQLWPEDHPKQGHHWGMAIDLNKCTGCSACLIACQAENNVPVVGKDEVYRQREMHWLRIDRYYSGSDDDLRVAHQPMMCHHCDNAPCETVCPVLATVHGDEGLNEQAYNRCVGTRYCANNCPYKVRRFNWFQYERQDPLQSLLLNPDVTVRSRGVMEKCSMCVQRIEEGKIAARVNGRPVRDGAIQTACQQSCPTQAISFGDMNNSQSGVREKHADPRNYRLFEEFNFRPAVSYLRVVRNRRTPPKEAKSHD